MTLPSGLVKPSAVSANVESVSELGKHAATLLEGRERPRELVLVLPNLSVTTIVLPESRLSRKRELVQRLTERLPYPAAEARFDFWRGSRGEVLGAAIRSVVARQYEQVAEAIGASLGWVDASTLISIPQWARSSRDTGGSGLAVELELYRSHYSLVAFRGGELLDLRFKLRPPGDVSGVASEVGRLPRMHDDPIAALSIYGEGASALGEELSRTESASAMEMSEDQLLSRASTSLLERARAS